MEKKKIAIFNVIEYDWVTKKIKPYNVLPYFRDVWKDKTFNLSKKDVVDKKTLKEWIIKASHYTFWARCEYECLIAPWPFGSKAMNEKLKKLLTADFNIDDYKQNVDFCNAVTTDMQKIDVHEQIMMNIDIIVEILSKEFKIE